MDTQPLGEPQQPSPVGHTVVVGPRRGIAVVWALVGLAATWMAGYAWAEGAQNPATAGMLALCVLATTLVIVQIAAPQVWTLHVDRHGVRGRLLGMHVDREFAGLRAVDVSRRFLEPRLVLRGHTHRTIILLPIGADTRELEAFLAELEAEASRVSSPTWRDAPPSARTDADADPSA